LKAYILYRDDCWILNMPRLVINGVAFSPGYSLIRHQALGAATAKALHGRYPLLSLTQSLQ
jgi:hypothetical protein